MEDSLPPIVTRFGEPSKMDTAKFGTMCRVSSNPESFDIYLQISHDEESPNWTYMGTYSSSVSSTYLYNEVQKILLSKQPSELLQ